jgi:hypothetical protein
MAARPPSSGRRLPGQPRRLPDKRRGSAATPSPAEDLTKPLTGIIRDGSVADLSEYRCQRGGICTCYGASMGMRSWSP